MIDEREDVTYPDGVESEDGRIYLVYDYRRTTDVVDFAKKSFSQGILVNPTTKLVTY